ncbi:pirin family protein [Limnovirga soli]|uniref:Pirin family protein n=1 Tax=Limnovirga soli TaxID=2656915 RepID=A0A8J8FDC1_9BACT|nr:pirin family protein [Limnovirga soli]NNV55918.1 pirin family protein [Limnovirga soli]
MKTILHTANERGHANHGWLNSYHSFSFAGFYDPAKIHFGMLRVLNDDTVKGGFGFSKHPHDNMEIVSIPLSGDLEHKDSTGRHEIIRENDVQIMSAGSGIAHSEMNANKDREVKFLQIWVFPKEQNITPRYQQKTFTPEQRHNAFLTVVAPDDDSAVWINQDAWFTLGNLDKGLSENYSIKKVGNGVYVFVLEGEITIDGQLLKKRDALGIWDTTSLTITATDNASVLLIDVPMQIEGVA